MCVLIFLSACVQSMQFPVQQFVVLFDMHKLGRKNWSLKFVSKMVKVLQYCYPG